MNTPAQFFLRSLRPPTQLVLMLLGLLLIGGRASAQGTLVSGQTILGNLSVTGAVHTWTFTAAIGDSVAVRVGDVEGDATLYPWVRLMGPNGVVLDESYGPVAAEVFFRTTNSGTFSVLVADGTAGQRGIGIYRITLAKSGVASSTSSGDEGGALINGAMHTGDISYGDLDVWNVDAVAGETLIVRLGDFYGTNTFYPWIRLFSPNGVLLDNQFGPYAAEVTFRATNSGTFTVVVGDGTSGLFGIGPYRLTLARTSDAVTVSNADEGGPLTNGVTHYGEILMGDLDVWHFNALAGDRFIARLGDLYATNSFYPWVRLYGPNGALLTHQYGPTAAEVSFRATNNGIFTVVVGDGNNGYFGTGAYRLNMVKTGDPVVISANDEGGPLTNGIMHTGEIGYGDLDAWTFSANAGEQLLVRLGDLNGTNSFYPWIRLLSPNGVLLDESYGPYAGEVVFRATNSGTFIVVVGDGTTTLFGIGPYRLTLAKTGSPIFVSNNDQGGTITNGVMHAGEIAYGDLDVWSFNATAGETFMVRLGDVNGTGIFYPWVRLYGPNGVLLHHSYGPYAAEATFRATNSGLVTVVVGDGNTGLFGTGPYRLTLAKTGDPIVVSAGDEGGPLTNAVMHTGDISYGDLDVWNFTAAAGDYLIVRLGDFHGTNTFYPWVRLLGPDGAFLSHSYGPYASEAEFRATNSGTFTLVVGDGATGIAGIGPYRLTLAKSASPITVSPGDQGGPLTNGFMHTGDLSYGDVDVWNFQGKAGETLIVRMGDYYGTNSIYPWVRLIGPNGALLAQQSGPQAAEAAFRATNSGVFTVVVGDGATSLAGVGPYRLSLAKSGSPIVAGPEDESGFLNGTIRDGNIPMGDVDLWTFTICEGERILVTVTETVSGSGLYPWIRLYGRDGALLNSTSNPGTARIDRLAPASGDYLLVLGDGNNGLRGEGAYHLDAPGLLGGTGVRFCDPVLLSAGRMANSGISGEAGAQFVIVTAFDITTPGPLWTPFLTNQFGLFGEFSFTNSIDYNQAQQYFRLRLP